MHCYQMSVLISRHSWPSLPLFFMNAFSYWLWLLHTLFLITLLICRQLWLYTVYIHDSERPVIPVQNKKKLPIFPEFRCWSNACHLKRMPNGFEVKSGMAGWICLLWLFWFFAGSEYFLSSWPRKRKCCTSIF